MTSGGNFKCSLGKRPVVGEKKGGKKVGGGNGAKTGGDEKRKRITGR